MAYAQVSHNHSCRCREQHSEEGCEAPVWGSAINGGNRRNTEASRVVQAYRWLVGLGRSRYADATRKSLSAAWIGAAAPAAGSSRLVNASGRRAAPTHLVHFELRR